LSYQIVFETYICRISLLDQIDRRSSTRKVKPLRSRK
jgi:hypothetical protein